ncbi:MAG TPA: PIN domain-containing protein [Spirochaetia bacterium]|nr:PIN domain-containing protein [Spirochaetia bacterium]
MIGVDTSFIVAFEIVSHPEHEHARAFARRYAAEGLGCAPQVLAECIHIVTDPRRFELPLSISDALMRAERWWNAVETTRVLPGPEAVTLFFEWMRYFELGRKRILDTLLAATYKAAGISLVVSTNFRDFSLFPGMHPLGPRSS